MALYNIAVVFELAPFAWLDHQLLYLNYILIAMSFDSDKKSGSKYKHSFILSFNP